MLVSRFLLPLFHNKFPKEYKGTVTTVNFTEEVTIGEALQSLTHPTQGVWAYHADDPV